MYEYKYQLPVITATGNYAIHPRFLMLVVLVVLQFNGPHLNT